MISRHLLCRATFPAQHGASLHNLQLYFCWGNKTSDTSRTAYRLGSSRSRLVSRPFESALQWTPPQLNLILTRQWPFEISLLSNSFQQMFATVLRRQIPAMPVQPPKNWAIELTYLGDSDNIFHIDAPALHGRACPLMPFPSLNAYPCPSMVCRETIPWLAFFCLLVAFSTTSVKHQHALPPIHPGWRRTVYVVYVAFFFSLPLYDTTQAMYLPKRKVLAWPLATHSTEAYRQMAQEEIVGIVEKHREQQKQQRMWLCVGVGLNNYYYYYGGCNWRTDRLGMCLSCPPMHAVLT